MGMSWPVTNQIRFRNCEFPKHTVGRPKHGLGLWPPLTEEMQKERRTYVHIQTGIPRIIPSADRQWTHVSEAIVTDTANDADYNAFCHGKHSTHQPTKPLRKT